MTEASDAIARQLRNLEGELLQTEIRRNPQAVASLLADDFCEFGSSGRIFSKSEIVEALRTEIGGQISITDFCLRSLTAETALVTYRAIRRADADQAGRTSLRSSMWVLRDGRWQMLFHQGTSVAGS
ncbi:MAG: DUF4440 domain-containing protein [Terriglobales bacterium]